MNWKEGNLEQFNLTIIDKITLDILSEPQSSPFLYVSKALIILRERSLVPSIRLRSFIEVQQARGYNQKCFNRYQEVNYGDTIFKYDDCIKVIG